MEYVIGAICLALSWLWLIRPFLIAEHVKAEKASNQVYLFTKLKIVRSYYSEMQDLTYTEILREYDVDGAYNNIGRHRRIELS